MIQDIQPEVIGTYQGRPTTSIEPVIEETIETPEVETPETPKEEEIVPEEKLQQLGTEFAQMAIKILQEDFNIKLGEKDNEMSMMQETHSQKENMFKENEKKGKEDTKLKEKEMSNKHKSELKSRDQEIKDLKTQLKSKDREVKSLLAQVKDALNEED